MKLKLHNRAYNKVRTGKLRILTMDDVPLLLNGNRDERRIANRLLKKSNAQQLKELK
jgi:hypothetical protein